MRLFNFTFSFSTLQSVKHIENLLLSNDAFLFHKQVGREGITRPGKSLVKVDFFSCKQQHQPRQLYLKREREAKSYTFKGQHV